jgi:hypothetical protein
MKKQIDDFQRCFPQKGEAAVVCEHDNGTFVIGKADEGAPANKNRLELKK